MESSVSLIEVIAITNSPSFLNIRLHNILCGMCIAAGRWYINVCVTNLEVLACFTFKVLAHMYPKRPLNAYLCVRQRASPRETLIPAEQIHVGDLLLVICQSSTLYWFFRNTQRDTVHKQVDL